MTDRLLRDATARTGFLTLGCDVPDDDAPVPMRLQMVPLGDLGALEQGLVPPSLAGRSVDGALMPPHVASRIRRHLADAKPAHWVSTYYILDADGWCVGGCGFKDSPSEREVEVGYAVAASRRQRGYAGAALRGLLRTAADSGEVDTVQALIAPGNVPSARLAARAGFMAVELVIDADGEVVVRWRCTLPAR